MIVLKIDVTKIPRERIVVGKKGKYLDLKLVENKDGTDQYGNDGFVSISVSKEEREQGVKGEIIGNWKHVGQKPSQQERRPAQQRPPATQRNRTQPSQPTRSRQSPPPDPDLDPTYPDGDEIPF